MIKQKVGKCITCSAQGPIIAKMCQTCYWKHRHEVNKDKEGNRQLKPRKPIASRSDKQLERDIEYAKLRKQWLPQHPVCEIGISGCTVKATQVHHMQGRIGELLLDTTNYLAVCHQCHSWCTEHSQEAIEMGYSKRRNT